MHCLRDATSFEDFLAHSAAPALAQLLQTRLDELLLDSDEPFLELVHFHVLALEDNTFAVEQEIGLDLLDCPIDLCAAHPDWFELTVILSDDGFGLVIFVPTSTQDAALKHRCTEISMPSAEAER